MKFTPKGRAKNTIWSAPCHPASFAVNLLRRGRDREMAHDINHIEGTPHSVYPARYGPHLRQTP